MLILAFDTSSRHASASLLSGTRELGSAHGQGTARHGDTLLPLIERVLHDAGIARTELGLLVVGTGPGSFTGLRVGLAVAKGLALGLGCPLVGVSSPVALVLAAAPQGGLVATAAAPQGGLVATAAAPQGGLVATATRAYRGEVYAGLWRVTGLAHATDEGDSSTAPSSLVVGGQRLRDPGHSASGVSSELELFAASPAEALARIRQAAGDEAFLCVGDGFEPDLIAELPAGAVRADAAIDAPQARQLALEGLRLFQRRGPDDASALVPHYVRGADAHVSVPQSASGSVSSR